MTNEIKFKIVWVEACGVSRLNFEERRADSPNFSQRSLQVISLKLAPTSPMGAMATHTSLRVPSASLSHEG